MALARVGRSAAIAVAALVLCACAPPAGTAPTGPAPTSTPGATTPPTAPPTAPRTIVDGLAAPWSIVRVGESALISERDSARILELTADGILREVTTVAGVAHGGEGGLLGLAYDGDAGVYAYATASRGNRVERYTLAGAPGDYALTDPVVVIDGLPAARTHNAGRIAFGPDGKLYVPVGDAGDRDAAQDPDALNGTILRLEPDGTIPADNPTPGSAVYSLGHRNVQGIAWTPDGTMYASEFGQNTWDELNKIVPGGNYGWPVVEGAGGADRGFVEPLQTWPTDAASPSGIAIIGDAIYIANLRGAVLRRVPLSDPTASEEVADEYGRLRDVIAGPDGTAWVLTNNTDGRGQPRDGDDRVLSVPVP